MAVPYESIFQKMMQEIQEARMVVGDHAEMKRRIANVKLLCELILEEETGSAAKRESQKSTTESVQNAHVKHVQYSGEHGNIRKVTDDDANGNSIFDF